MLYNIGGSQIGRIHMDQQQQQTACLTSFLKNLDLLKLLPKMFLTAHFSKGSNSTVGEVHVLVEVSAFIIGILRWRPLVNRLVTQRERCFNPRRGPRGHSSRTASLSYRRPPSPFVIRRPRPAEEPSAPRHPLPITFDLWLIQS